MVEHAIRLQPSRRRTKCLLFRVWFDFECNALHRAKLSKSDKKVNMNNDERRWENVQTVVQINLGKKEKKQNRALNRNYLKKICFRSFLREKVILYMKCAHKARRRRHVTIVRFDNCRYSLVANVKNPVWPAMSFSGMADKYCLWLATPLPLLASVESPHSLDLVAASLDPFASSDSLSASTSPIASLPVRLLSSAVSNWTCPTEREREQICKSNQIESN